MTQDGFLGVEGMNEETMYAGSGIEVHDAVHSHEAAVANVGQWHLHVRNVDRPHVAMILSTA